MARNGWRWLALVQLCLLGLVAGSAGKDLQWCVYNAGSQQQCELMAETAPTWGAGSALQCLRMLDYAACLSTLSEGGVDIMLAPLAPPLELPRGLALVDMHHAEQLLLEGGPLSGPAGGARLAEQAGPVYAWVESIDLCQQKLAPELLQHNVRGTCQTVNCLLNAPDGGVLVTLSVLESLTEDLQNRYRMVCPTSGCQPLQGELCWHWQAPSRTVVVQSKGTKHLLLAAMASQLDQLEAASAFSTAIDRQLTPSARLSQRGAVSLSGGQAAVRRLLQTPTDSPPTTSAPANTPAPTPEPPADTPSPPAKTPEPPALTPAPPAPTPAPPAPTPAPPAPTPAPPAPTLAPPAPTPAPPAPTPAPPAPTPAPPAPTFSTQAPVTPAPTQSTSAPNTPAPTLPPATSAPTLAPTLPPATAAPTAAPTIAATPAPTLPVTAAPTNPPTLAPTPVPTQAATPAPTPAATTGTPLTPAPTVALTVAPTVAATVAPTPVPTSAATPPPTLAGTLPPAVTTLPPSVTPAVTTPPIVSTVAPTSAPTLATIPPGTSPPPTITASPPVLTPSPAPISSTLAPVPIPPATTSIPPVVTPTGTLTPPTLTSTAAPTPLLPSSTSVPITTQAPPAATPTGTSPPVTTPAPISTTNVPTLPSSTPGISSSPPLTPLPTPAQTGTSLPTAPISSTALPTVPSSTPASSTSAPLPPLPTGTSLPTTSLAPVTATPVPTSLSSTPASSASPLPTPAQTGTSLPTTTLAPISTPSVSTLLTSTPTTSLTSPPLTPSPTSPQPGTSIPTTSLAPLSTTAGTGLPGSTPANLTNLPPTPLPTTPGAGTSLPTAPLTPLSTTFGPSLPSSAPAIPTNSSLTPSITTPQPGTSIPSTSLAPVATTTGTGSPGSTPANSTNLLLTPLPTTPGAGTSRPTATLTPLSTTFGPSLPSSAPAIPTNSSLTPSITTPQSGTSIPTTFLAPISTTVAPRLPGSTPAALTNPPLLSLPTTSQPGTSSLTFAPVSTTAVPNTPGMSPIPPPTLLPTTPGPGTPSMTSFPPINTTVVPTLPSNMAGNLSLTLPAPQTVPSPALTSPSMLPPSNATPAVIVNSTNPTVAPLPTAPVIVNTSQPTASNSTAPQSVATPPTVIVNASLPPSTTPSALPSETLSPSLNATTPRLTPVALAPPFNLTNSNPTTVPIVISPNTSAPIITPRPEPTFNLTVTPLVTPFLNISQLNGTIAPAPPLIFPPPPPSNKNCLGPCPSGTALRPGDLTCDCVLPMIVDLAFQRGPQQFLPNVPEFVQEFADATNLTSAQVSVQAFRLVLRSGRKLLQSDSQELIVTTWLLPVATPSNPAPMQLPDNQTAAIADALISKRLALDPVLFGNYSVIQILPPGVQPPPPAPGVVPIASTPIGVPVTSGTTTSAPSSNSASSGDSGSSISAGAIVGIVIAAVVGGLILLCVAGGIIVLRRRRKRGHKSVDDGDRSGQDGLSKSFPHVFSVGSLGQETESSYPTVSGSAREFTYQEIVEATENFNPNHILGEGGFGQVFGGKLPNGKAIAVKRLTRDGTQGIKEFISEVDLLSHLHHKHLVKLVGYHASPRGRLLIYDLIPNGSVESHLHGIDSYDKPLDWETRVKVALGAARGLVYLHEDSNPRIIHRDFKASNILLDNDYTAKVSDFGLAKAAPDDESGHISTRVMGTFGYVAPEYAMTGHLLVKSDVYSYGVVLLELLSGRKPVDMDQPPGQENLVTWARPLLTSKQGLEQLVDPTLAGKYNFDDVARVAAIASMCVQPEVSHRPFMVEVVQALKVVHHDADRSTNGSDASDIIIYDIDGRAVRRKASQDLTNTGLSKEFATPAHAPERSNSGFHSIDFDSGVTKAESGPQELASVTAAALDAGLAAAAGRSSWASQNLPASAPVSTATPPVVIESPRVISRPPPALTIPPVDGAQAPPIIPPSPRSVRQFSPARRSFSNATPTRSRQSPLSGASAPLESPQSVNKDSPAGRYSSPGSFRKSSPGLEASTARRPSPSWARRSTSLDRDVDGGKAEEEKVDPSGMAPGSDYSGEMEYFDPEKPGLTGPKWARKK